MAIPPVLPPWRRNPRSLPCCRRWTLFPEMPDLRGNASFKELGNSIHLKKRQAKCHEIYKKPESQANSRSVFCGQILPKKPMPMSIQQNVWNLLFEGCVPMQTFQTNFIRLSRKKQRCHGGMISKFRWMQWFNWWLHWPCWTMIWGVENLFGIGCNIEEKLSL